MGLQFQLKRHTIKHIRPYIKTHFALPVDDWPHFMSDLAEHTNYVLAQKDQRKSFKEENPHEEEISGKPHDVTSLSNVQHMWFIFYSNRRLPSHSKDLAKPSSTELAKSTDLGSKENALHFELLKFQEYQITIRTS